MVYIINAQNAKDDNMFLEKREKQFSLTYIIWINPKNVKLCDVNSSIYTFKL